jgi:hypothetical protein
VADGVTFLGWRISPNHTRLVHPNVIRFRQGNGVKVISSFRLAP